MTRNLFYFSVILFATLVTLGNGASKCTEGKDGFMYCEDISSQGQAFLKKRDSEDVCLNAENDETYGVVTGFNIIAFNKIKATSLSVNGRFIAKNSVTVDGFSIDINEKCKDSKFPYGVYTDKFTVNNWGGSVNGGIHYGSDINMPNYLYNNIKNNGCPISNDSSENVDFDAIKTKIEDISAELAQKESDTNVVPQAANSPNIKIVLKKDQTNYVISGDENTFYLGPNKGFNFLIEDNNTGLDPKDVSIIFNLKGKSFIFGNASFNLGKYARSTVWNLPEATSVSLGSVSFYGLLIAPNAEVTFDSGNFYGDLYCNSLDVKNFAIGNNNSFNGCLPVGKKVKYRTETVCTDENVSNREINSDIVFIVDESQSMSTYIAALKNKLGAFIDELNKVNANARFAVVGFGGKPRIYTPFTNDTEKVKKAFANLKSDKGGQESGLEAIRMFLKKSNKFLNYSGNGNGNGSFTSIDKLAWREGSTKTIILVTDEDSDLPHHEENRTPLQISNFKKTITLKSGSTYSESYINDFVGFPYYLNKNFNYNHNIHDYSSYFEPTFSPVILTTVNNHQTFYRNGYPLVLGEPYQQEVDETAELLLQENVQLFMLLNNNLVNAQGKDVPNSQYDSNNPYWNQGITLFKHSDDSSTVTAQYGNPNLDTVSNTDYNRDDILNQLTEKKQNKSIQGQILAGKGFCRAFNINDFNTEDSNKVVDLFYNTVVSTVQKCSVVKIPIEEETETTPSPEPTEKEPEEEEIVWPTGPYRNVTVCDDVEHVSKEINSDIVFIFDESASMCKYITAMRNKLNEFITELNKAKANARFAIIGFGGKRRIYSAFTSDVESVKKAFKNVNCEQSGQESGLEAISMFLKKSDKFINRISSTTSNSNFKNIDQLEWREGSSKTIILVTDEDSDLPHYEENMTKLQLENIKKSINVIGDYYEKEVDATTANGFMGYSYYMKMNTPSYSSKYYFEPSFSPAILTSVKGITNFYRNGSPLVLSEPYQQEVDATANLIIEKNIQLFMLLNDNLVASQGSDVANSQFDEHNPYWKSKNYSTSDDSSTITAQYGNPLLDDLSEVKFERE